MTKNFNNANEMAKYFILEEVPFWDYPEELEKAELSAVKYLFNEMYKKYVRGKSVFARECEEYENAEKNALKEMTEFLENNYKFPCEYKVVTTYYDWGGSKKITVTPLLQQITLFDLEEK